MLKQFDQNYFRKIITAIDKITVFIISYTIIKSLIFLLLFFSLF